MAQVMRYLSASSLDRAWTALGGEDPAPPGALDAIVDAASEVALHAAAAAFLVEIVKRRPFGVRSEHMALVAADLVYQTQGWTLPDGQGDQFDTLVQRVAAGEADVHHVADQLAAAARPRPSPY